MHVYIRCCSCGNNIGAFYEAYISILNDRKIQELTRLKSEVDLDHAIISDKIQVSMDDVFDAMQIFRYCCRMRLIGVAVITDIKKSY